MRRPFVPAMCAARSRPPFAIAQGPFPFVPTEYRPMTSSRTLHGFTTPNFPNLIQLGPMQNASSVNFSHILDEQAVHAAALVAAAESDDALLEPTPEAVAAWRATCADGAADHEWFHAECTPGYYNNEGKGWGEDAPLFVGHPGGALAYFAHIDAWRKSGRFEGLEFA